MAKRIGIGCLVLLSLIFGAALAETTIVTPENIGTVDFSENGAYAFQGDFSGADLVIPAGKTITLDAKEATFSGHVRITLGGIADDASQIFGERSGNYVICNFKIADSLSVRALHAKSITVQGCELKALDFNASNSEILVSQNIIDGNGTYERHDGAVQNSSGIYVYADHYDLSIVNNTVSGQNATLTFQGNYEQFQQGTPHGTIQNTVSVTGNTLSVQNKSGNILHIYNDAVYAPVAWPADYEATAAMQTLAQQIFRNNTLQNVCQTDVLNVLMRKANGPDQNSSEKNFQPFMSIEEAMKTEKGEHWRCGAGEEDKENEAGSGYDLVTRCTVCQSILNTRHVSLQPSGGSGSIDAGVPTLQTQPGSGETQQIPKTGDSAQPALWLAAAALCAAAAVSLLKKRKQA